MSLVFLVRHSMSTGEVGDAGLSSAGWELARRAATRLMVPGSVRLFSSPLRRARETAQCFGDALGREVTVDDRLRERENWGDVPGDSWEEFVARWERCNVERDYVPPGGRSSRQAGDALTAFVRDAAAAADTVLGVSHGGVIVDFLLNLFSPEELAAHRSDYREMAHCALTEIEVRGEEYTLRRFADPCLIAES